MNARLKIANRTDIGKIRKINEDRSAVLPELNGYALALVADGMGGHQAGDVASRMAADIICGELSRRRHELPGHSLEKVLLEAIRKANDDVYAFSNSQASYYGMGTTVVAAIASVREATIGHIGDSRAYLYRAADGGLIQLTEDHSLVNELLRSGQITEEEAATHPRRNVLTRALGTDPQVEVDIERVEWGPRDILMLCSDGLSGLVSGEELLGILASSDDLEAKADRLVQSALDAGGEDNITVVLLANEDNQGRDEVQPTQEGGAP